MEFFTAVFDALTTTQIDLKLQKVEYLQTNFYTYDMQHDTEIQSLVTPSYASFCKVIHPTRLQRPKGGNSKESLAKILHSIAHIEYNAIDLGLDAAYRFRNLPLEYYNDFTTLASEEVLHFRLLESLLKMLGYSYGDFPVHDNLFCAMQNTQKLIDRMALVHKGLEAMGLDANPFVKKKIEQAQTPLKHEILAVLDRIMHDEIGHVAKGVKWLTYAQELCNDNRSLCEILQEYDFNVIGKIPNIEARLKAGYSMQEIESLQQSLK
ncbi:ferritin-like domain-containing protein [Helicobacter trogontum]|uniref:Ferritin-like domain-containing protein n=1 Tax=Helicobacter trogontum TaxID=50960 RepID=A0A4U8TEY0_9HELI|nr:ferritin-like domain-containing protein [Helicobacter trogontum]MCI5786692.1 ferritin-like domain-containing protein [Helicobacter trogontum]MDY5186105.1 ferritin-like domain-containing protein [Helicobacter trogontum]TLD98620.1 ferritin-like domain-containing protein [Helicobacter trogontum]